FPIINHANQITYLDKLIKFHKSTNPPNTYAWPDLDTSIEYSPVYISPQDGLMEADKIDAMPGQPEGVKFDQYAGYVTVDPTAGRALFYYFVESPENSSTNPLVLWPRGKCSSLTEAMEKQGPFGVNSDGKTLHTNEYAWNNVANVIFLESPFGVGFSYSNTSSDYNNGGDNITAKDAYVFLVNWLERFPKYKTRDLYITGELYGGHSVPQLAYTILLNNKNTNQTVINLKGIASDEYYQTRMSLTFAQCCFRLVMLSLTIIHNISDLSLYIYSDKCTSAREQAASEYGNINVNSIYSPLCHEISNSSIGSMKEFDPCTDKYVEAYLNIPEVQKAIHAIPTTWYSCRNLIEHEEDRPTTILPIISNVMASGISVWLYSGDMDGIVPVTSTKYSIDKLKLSIKTAWYAWYISEEVGGYAVEYEGLIFVTVRRAGTPVSKYQPERALTMFSSFIQGKLPPT
ncbi:hypothetical protein AQUCO_01500137v1, partial [Aquilegia coerulea]